MVDRRGGVVEGLLGPAYCRAWLEIRRHMPPVGGRWCSGVGARARAPADSHTARGAVERPRSSAVGGGRAAGSGTTWCSRAPSSRGRISLHHITIGRYGSRGRDTRLDRRGLGRSPSAGAKRRSRAALPIARRFERSAVHQTAARLSIPNRLLRRGFSPAEARGLQKGAASGQGAWRPGPCVGRRGPGRRGWGDGQDRRRARARGCRRVLVAGSGGGGLPSSSLGLSLGR